jgi:hypothetical protein
MQAAFSMSGLIGAAGHAAGARAAAYLYSYYGIARAGPI